MDRRYKQSFSEFAQVSVAVFALYKFTKDPHFLRAGTSAIVKDYQMPADEQGLSDCIIAWGRRQIILRGGNRGVEAAVAE